MAREILNPRWGNDRKTLIVTRFRYDDGHTAEASISVPEGGSNSDWDEIIEKFGKNYLDQQTQIYLKKERDKKLQVENQRKLDFERMQKEQLFNAKAEAFDIDLVKNSTNREVKNKIRRAKNIMEVQIYAALLHMLEDPLANPTTTSTPDDSVTETTNT